MYSKTVFHIIHTIKETLTNISYYVHFQGDFDEIEQYLYFATDDRKGHL